jgi:AcrR family transcriptional regulator
MDIGKPDPAGGNGARNGQEPVPGEDSGQALSRREREKRQCKQEILAAASELFAQLGYEKTAMKQIAEKVGVSVGALYSHFPGKDEMLRELLIQSIEELERVGNEACRLDDPPLLQLRRRMAASLEHFKAHIDFMMIYNNESPHSLEGIVQAEIARNIELVASLFDQAMTRGDIPRSDPKELAAVIVGAFHELMRVFTDTGARERLNEIPGIVDRLIIMPLETQRRTELGMEERS